MDAPYGGLSPRDGIVVDLHGSALHEEPVGRTRLEEVHVGIDDLLGELLEGRDVIQDPETTSIGPDHQVVEMLLDHQPMHGRVGEVGLKRLPVRPVIEGDVDPVLRSGVQEPLPGRDLPERRGRS